MDGEGTVPYYNHAHITQPVTRTHELREVLREGARRGGGEAVGRHGEAVVPRYVVPRQRHLKARAAEPPRSAVLHVRQLVISIAVALSGRDITPAW